MVVSGKVEDFLCIDLFFRRICGRNEKSRLQNMKIPNLSLYLIQAYQLEMGASTPEK
jgi:hypothetical protein